MAGTYIKDPEATLDYGVDWTQWLGGDEIVESTWRVAPVATPGQHLEILATVAPTVTGKTTKVWVHRGVLGQVYELVNRVATLGGRTDERTLRINIRHK